MELAEAFDHPGGLLWYDTDAVVDGSLDGGGVGSDGGVGGGGVVVREWVGREKGAMNGLLMRQVSSEERCGWGDEEARAKRATGYGPDERHVEIRGAKRGLAET